jgi:hypothetical protein
LFFTCQDVSDAIEKLHPHENDVNLGLSTDNFLDASRDLSVHITFLFASMAIHGTAPSEFGVSTIVPIQKERNITMADSNNFRGIALSSIFIKYLTI